MSNASDTVVDLARWGGLTQGVCAMDAALAGRRCTHAELADAVDRLPTGARGIRSARTAVHLADESAESPGESVSRIRMWQATLPRPALQHEVRIDGELYRLDFLWPHTMVGGEFDGRIKYAKNSFGKDADDTVWDERQRELGEDYGEVVVTGGDSKPRERVKVVSRDAMTAISRSTEVPEDLIGQPETGRVPERVAHRLAD